MFRPSLVHPHLATQATHTGQDHRFIDHISRSITQLAQDKDGSSVDGGINMVDGSLERYRCRLT